jgi:hypothetical protein
VELSNDGVRDLADEEGTMHPVVTVVGGRNAKTPLSPLSLLPRRAAIRL